MVKSNEVIKVPKQSGIREVSVEVSRTINLGNYESVRYSCAVVYDVGLDKGETADEAYANALAFCKKKVVAEVDRLTSK